MKRRFQVTLLAVAIAVVSSTAFAMAPVIGAVRSPVIADDTPATTANNFFYPDALDADTLATDPDGTVTPDGIIWSYYSDSGNYQINGQDSLDPENVANDPNAPTAAQDLDNDNDPGSLDSNARTLTFRDSGYSPISGLPGPFPDPNPTNETTEVIRQEVVTLFASDGSSWSMKNVLVYTESNGRDRLSSSGVEDLNETPSVSAGWVSTIILGDTTQVLLTDNAGLCIQVPGPGNNYAQWLSPYDIVSLVQNAVYRIRLTMDTNSTTIPVNTTPFWDFVIDNFDGASAQNKYAADFMNQDNEGGANSVSSVGTFDVWFTPPPVTAADWNDATNGQFVAANDANNDMRFNFRVLDVTGSVDGANDAGIICLRNITVTRYDISELAPAGAALYDVSNITASTHVVGTVFGTDRTTTNFTGGNVTISPNTGGPQGNNAWDLEVITVDPGNTVVTPGTEILDNFPVQWDADTLLKGTLTVQAPNATGESNPVDVISLTWDTPTNEILQRNEVYAATNTNGLPKAAGTTDLVSFFYTHGGTLSSGAEFDHIRMRVLLLLTESINSGNSADNLGGVTITAEKIEAISIP